MDVLDGGQTWSEKVTVCWQSVSLASMYEKTKPSEISLGQSFRSD